jgi:hypothetical protein
MTDQMILARAGRDDEEPWQAVQKLFAKLLQDNRNLKAKIDHLERQQQVTTARLDAAIGASLGRRLP